MADYGNDYTNRFGERRTVQLSGGETVPQEDFSPEACADEGVEDCGLRITEQSIDLSTLASVGYEFANGDLIQLTSLLLRKTSKEVLITRGEGEEFLGENTRLDWTERQAWTNQLLGEHAFALFENDAFYETVLNWRATYGIAERDVLGRRDYTYEYDEIDEVFRFSRESLRNQLSYGDLKDTSFELGVDVIQPLLAFDRDVDIKFGFAYLEQERESDFRRLTFQNPSGFARDLDLRELRPEEIFTDEAIGPDGFRLLDVGDISEAFEADFENVQAYFQIDAQVTDTLRAALGFRYEDSTQTSESRARSNIPCGALDPSVQPEACASGTTAFQAGDIVPVSLDDSYLLPAATLTWEFLPDMQLRFAYSQTINRPSLREISTSPFLDPDRDVPIVGNPFLEIAEVDNFDLRWEYYFADEQYVTVGAFYKDLEGPIERTLVSGAGPDIRSFINAESGELYGIEVEFRVNLPINEWLSALGEREFFLLSNFTYIDSDVSLSEEQVMTGNLTDASRRLQGQSDLLANFQLGYYDASIDERASLLFNYTGERIESVGTFDRPNTIEAPPTMLDLVYSRGFITDLGIWTIKAELRNLLNDDYQLRSGTVITERYDIGRTVEIGVSFQY